MVKEGSPRYVPNRGDIIWIQFSQRRGHEQGGRRPAIILSSKQFSERTSFIFCCPITSKVKGYVFEVPIAAGRIRGAVLADQAYTFDWQARRPTYAARAPEAVVSKVGELISILAQGA
ncbi:hypothetical protein A3H16_02675 [Candidatus Kaiserbacteria bacterium RIFCSPLOWO2_12_FULL_53_8]|uniref:mRNA-degrading endonuclease n=2 Tax=Candidatus Kaiseribacteriota TaxID=1752734 RepID=A0A1F6CZD3_9BACT|nr:MAG: hypothetical protein A2851_00870 [Candidatus Kaiserbacteria bacterium RIFCSPHIGHO2_01_FULL_53_29]OGG92068.1 MAG: hypothetical protein A3H16_02675 [Candidatus Kaiserbacteria bacterium RIFCSPLOWO2_12_FULL_53_8]